jgi:hypothetical protein
VQHLVHLVAEHFEIERDHDVGLAVLDHLRASSCFGIQRIEMHRRGAGIGDGVIGDHESTGSWAGRCRSSCPFVAPSFPVSAAANLNALVVCISAQSFPCGRGSRRPGGYRKPPRFFPAWKIRDTMVRAHSTECRADRIFPMERMMRRNFHSCHCIVDCFGCKSQVV